VKFTEVGGAKFNKGERVSGEDAYFITSPTFQTTSKKYAWLNDAVFVNKWVEIGEKGGHVQYDTYMVVPQPSSAGKVEFHEACLTCPPRLTLGSKPSCAVQGDPGGGPHGTAAIPFIRDIPRRAVLRRLGPPL
jgi:hypothetical protein